MHLLGPCPGEERNWGVCQFPARVLMFQLALAKPIETNKRASGGSWRCPDCSRCQVQQVCRQGQVAERQNWGLGSQVPR